MSCVEQSSQLTLTVAAVCWEVWTATSTRADDSLYVLLLQLSVSLSLLPSLSQLSPLSASPSVCAFLSLSLQRERAQLLISISRAPAAVLTRRSLDFHTLPVSILTCSPPSLSPHPLSLSLTCTVCALVFCICTLSFDGSQAHTHTGRCTSLKPYNSKLCTHPHP